MGDEEIQVPPVVTPVVETESKLTEPLIDHAGKIAHIEERQAHHEQELLRQISDLESRLANATGSQISAIEARIAGLESKLEEAAKPVEEAPDDAVEFSVPDVEQSPEPPEKVRRGLRHRRKARREKK